MAVRNPAPNVEYDFVSIQAAGRAVCPFCGAWHSRSSGATIEGGSCKARYIRLRKAAILVRGKPLSMGSGYRVPDSGEISVSLEHAVNVVHS
jgi:hypothetical protein